MDRFQILTPSEVNDHTVNLTGLIAGTAYHFQVAGNDSGSNNYWSADNTLLTSGVNAADAAAAAAAAAAPPVGPSKVTIKEAPSETVAPKITLTPPSKTVFAETPKFSGTATDNESVARIEYSIDGGANWQVAQEVKALGAKSTTYSFTPVMSQDDDYVIMTRAIDTSGNIGTSSLVKVTVDRLSPVVGDAVINIGPQVIDPDIDGSFATITGIDQTITVKSIGGSTSINLQSSKVGMAGAANSFGLTRSKSGLWSGVVGFQTAGNYEVSALAIDGAGNKTKRLLARFKVSDSAQLVDMKSGQPVSGRVTVYYKVPNTVNWERWDGSGFGVANPIDTGKSGNFNLYLPKGDYYLDITAGNYRDTYSKVFTLNEPGPLVGKIALSKARMIKLGGVAIT